MTDLERLESTDIVPTPEMAAPLTAVLVTSAETKIFTNTDTTIENFARIMKEKGIKPELEVFDKGMIDTALKVADRKGLLVHPMHFDFVLGVQMTATIRDLVFMAESIPAGSTWTATGLGKNAWHIAAATISLGGHVRVGFEDNLYMEKGVLAESNGRW